MGLFVLVVLFGHLLLFCLGLVFGCWMGWLVGFVLLFDLFVVVCFVT